MKTWAILLLMGSGMIRDILQYVVYLIRRRLTRLESNGLSFANRPQTWREMVRYPELDRLSFVQSLWGPIRVKTSFAREATIGSPRIRYTLSPLELLTVGFWFAAIELFWRTRNDFELISLTIIPMGLAGLLPLRGFPRRITESGIQLWNGNVIHWVDIEAVKGLDFLGFKLFYREGEKIKEVAVTNLRPFWLVWETIRRNAPHAQVDPDWFPIDAIDLSDQDGKTMRNGNSSTQENIVDSLRDSTPSLGRAPGE